VNPSIRIAPTRTDRICVEANLNLPADIRRRRRRRRLARVKGPVHVLLLEMPHLLRDILEHAIRQHEQCELVSDTFPPVPGARVFPDAVILGLSAQDDLALVPGLFARWPAARILTVTQDGSSMAVCEWKPRCQVLGQLSPGEVVDTLCIPAHPPGPTAPK
jgi:hypothetical protein